MCGAEVPSMQQSLRGQNSFPRLIAENTGNEANIEWKYFIFAYILTVLELAQRIS